MKRILALLPLLFACGTLAYLPDGGRPHLGSTNSFTVIPVKTIDVTGVPIADALVTATNQSNGKVLTGTTNGNGDTAAITEEIGEGQIAIGATAGALQTRMGFIVQLVCGECDCTSAPGSATIILQ